MIDFTEFFASLDNDPESISMILEAYLDEYSDCHLVIEQLVSKQQWQDLFILAHSVKGILASFGANDLLPVLEQVEQQAKQADEVDPELLQTLYRTLPTIQAQIEQQNQQLSA